MKKDSPNNKNQSIQTIPSSLFLVHKKILSPSICKGRSCARCPSYCVQNYSKGIENATFFVCRGEAQYIISPSSLSMVEVARIKLDSKRDEIDKGRWLDLIQEAHDAGLESLEAKLSAQFW